MHDATRNTAPIHRCTMHDAVDGPSMCAACCAALLLQVPDSVRQNVRANQRYMHPGANFVMLNGMLMEVKNFELYSE